MNNLHIGCGKRLQPGAIGIDINPASDADILCNLEAALPFQHNTFEVIICEHVLEHIDNLVFAIDEIYRVGKPGGLVIVEVPYFSSVHYYQDPTHRHPFTAHTFDYFIEGTEVCSFNYSSTRFIIQEVKFPPPHGAGIFKRSIFGWINQHIDYYEKHFAFILPRHLLRFELRIEKA